MWKANWIIVFSDDFSVVIMDWNQDSYRVENFPYVSPWTLGATRIDGNSSAKTCHYLACINDAS